MEEEYVPCAMCWSSHRLISIARILRAYARYRLWHEIPGSNALALTPTLALASRDEGFSCKKQQGDTYFYIPRPSHSILPITMSISFMVRNASDHIISIGPTVDIQVVHCEAGMFLGMASCVRMRKVRVVLRLRVHLLLRKDPVLGQLSRWRIRCLNRGWSGDHEVWRTPFRQRIRLSWFVTRTRRVQIRWMLTTRGARGALTIGRVRVAAMLVPSCSDSLLLSFAWRADLDCV